MKSFAVSGYDKSVAMAVIPKCAKTSIERTIAPITRITPDEAMAYPTRVMFVRDPVDRLLSFYAMVLAQELKPNFRFADSSVGWDGWSSYVDWALTSQNEHVLPQVGLVTTSDGRFAPTVVHPFSRLQEVWETYYRTSIPNVDARAQHMNRSPKWAKQGVDLTYRMSEIESRYAEDFKLCRQVQS